MPLTVRRAKTYDARLLFDWVNTPDSLAQKERTAGPIAWDDHCAWLGSQLANPSAFIFIVDIDGAPAGQIRLSPTGRHHEIDIYIEVGMRRKGYAAAAVSAALQEALVSSVIARVKQANVASKHLFQSLGFQEVRAENDMIIFEKGQLES